MNYKKKYIPTRKSAWYRSGRHHLPFWTFLDRLSVWEDQMQEFGMFMQKEGGC